MLVWSGLLLKCHSVLKQPCGKKSTLKMKGYVLVYADTYVEGVYEYHIGDQVLKNE